MFNQIFYPILKDWTFPSIPFLNISQDKLFKAQSWIIKIGNDNNVFEFSFFYQEVELHWYWNMIFIL